MYRYVAFDVKTPNRYNNRISAIGICLIEDGEIRDRFFSYVNPETFFDSFNTQLTGIDASTVKEAPTFPELWKQIEPVFSDGILLAHNANFDASFLRVAYAKNPQLVPVNPVIDSLVMARTILPELSNHKLGFMAGLFMKRGEFTMKIDPAKMHRAVYDCEMLMEVFVALLRRRFKEKDWEMANIMASLAKYKGVPQFINK